MSNLESIVMTELEKSEASEPILNGNMDIIKNVKVKLTVKVGEADITVDELMNLADGSVVPINREVSSPVDLLLEDKVVARGRLVAANENFGIQVTELHV